MKHLFVGNRPLKYTRENGTTFTFYSVDSTFTLDGDEYRVVEASRRKDCLCSKCEFRNLTPDECLELRRNYVGECVSWCRGDGLRVNFKKISL